MYRKTRAVQIPNVLDVVMKKLVTPINGDSSL